MTQKGDGGELGIKAPTLRRSPPRFSLAGRRLQKLPWGGQSYFVISVPLLKQLFTGAMESEPGSLLLPIHSSDKKVNVRRAALSFDGRNSF